jgi:hypothetical protein
MSEPPQVKVCPFCGAWPILTRWIAPKYRKRWSLECDGCAFIIERHVRQELVRAWNRRSFDSTPGNPHLRSKP